MYSIKLGNKKDDCDDEDQINEGISFLGFDPEDFLNERSEMFEYFNWSKFRADPVKVFSLNQVIKE